MSEQTPASNPMYGLRHAHSGHGNEDVVVLTVRCNRVHLQVE